MRYFPLDQSVDKTISSRLNNFTEAMAAALSLLLIEIRIVDFQECKYLGNMPLDYKDIYCIYLTLYVDTQAQLLALD